MDDFRMKHACARVCVRGVQEGTLKAYDDIAPKSLSTGQKIDIAMAKARLALRFDDWTVAKERITEAKE